MLCSIELHTYHVHILYTSLSGHIFEKSGKLYYHDWISYSIMIILTYTTSFYYLSTYYVYILYITLNGQIFILIIFKFLIKTLQNILDL